MCDMLSFVMAIEPEFKSLLRNDGIMEKNTLKITDIILSEEKVDCDSDSPDDYCGDEINVSGEIILTGVLVWRPNREVYFFPDNNIKNIFYDDQQVIDCKRERPISECYKIKPSQSHPIFISYDKDMLLKSLGINIFGKQAMRAKIYLTIDVGYMSASRIVPITPVKKVYSTYTPPSDDCDYYCSIDDIIVSMYQYTSKDSYVNIRQTPKGAIVGQIQKADMQKPKSQRGAILGASCYKHSEGADPFYCPDENGWYEVFYFPPNKRNGKDAIHGYIHRSQIKVD